MIVEIEVKLRLTDPDLLFDKLREFSAVHDRHFLETNTYFDLPDGQLKTTDQGLRVRIEKNTATGRSDVMVTHKGPRAHGRLKSRSETEMSVSDARAATEMLGVLGYQPVLTFEKRRDRYLLDGCRVEIDRIPHLGTFVEIEGASENEVLAVQAKLGMADQPLIRASYIAMLSTWLSENNDPRTTIRFADDTQAAGAV